MAKAQPPVIKPFNPLDKVNLGESVAEAMLHQQVGALPPSPFIGAGIYAIYYLGSFSLYAEQFLVNTRLILAAIKPQICVLCLSPLFFCAQRLDYFREWHIVTTLIVLTWQ